MTQIGNVWDNPTIPYIYIYANNIQFQSENYRDLKWEADSDT